jgi:hypothetical protein
MRGLSFPDISCYLQMGEGAVAEIEHRCRGPRRRPRAGGADRFYPYDDRAHMQIDGREVTLFKRLALSGVRYTGAGVALRIGKTGITIKHARRPATACELS